MEIYFDKNVTINTASGEKAFNIIDMYKDYYRNYRVENHLNKKNFEYDKSMSLEQKDKALGKALLAAVQKNLNMTKPAELSFENWAGQTVIKEMTFGIVSGMIDAILPETLIDDIGIYTDVRVGAFGDSFAFDVKPRELFTVSQSGHGKRTAFIQKNFKTTKTLIPVNHEVTVESSLYKVLAGKESLGDFTAKAVRSIESQMTYDCYDAMNAALTGASMPAALKLTGFTQDSAITLAQTVTAWNGGNKAMFVGTKNALSKIVPYNANYRYDIESEYVKIAHLQEFGGVTLMELPQIADYNNAATFGLKLSDDYVYVISPAADKLVKLGIEGSVLSYVTPINGNANLTQDATFNKSWDAQVITSAIAGSIKVA